MLLDLWSEEPLPIMSHGDGKSDPLSPCIQRAFMLIASLFRCFYINLLVTWSHGENSTLSR